jgi:AcrR family transcriptional regulator
MAAFTELLAERGYNAVRIGELSARAGVSRATFYEHFADKQQCLIAAYDHFMATLLSAMTTEIDQRMPWSEFIDATLAGYLGTLERDPTAARAFVIEMDAAGRIARERRRTEVHSFAALLTDRHQAMRALHPSLGPLPEPVWLTVALAVRELVRDALEDDRSPPLTELAPNIKILVAALIEGAAKAQHSRR